MNKAIQQYFADIPGAYELINHLITFGLDSLWRRNVTAKAALCRQGNWLDICSGTGQLARSLSKLELDDTRIIACDFSYPMLNHAVRKAGAGFQSIEYVLGDALDLPFPDNSFELITIAFATRNLNAMKGHLHRAYSEFQRVLKSGGTFINVETSQPSNKLIKSIYHQYVKFSVLPVGRLFSGSSGSYRYLSHSIRHFHSSPELTEKLLEAGFSRVSADSKLFGVVAIHTAVK